MSDHHVHIHLDDVTALTDAVRHGLAHLAEVITQEGRRMSDAATNLTDAVQAMQASVETLTTTLQAEMQDIAAALSNATTDEALRAAAMDAVTRLHTTTSKIDDLNTTVQNIIT